MALRRLGVLLVLLLSAGCTRTIYYAVIAPNTAANDSDSCFRGCQMLRAAGTKQYLACLKTCRDVRVVQESECSDVAVDPHQYSCTTEHNQTFSPGPVILLIVVSVLTLVIVGSLSSSSQSSSNP